MEFLSPWYLLGAAAIAVPILLHLRKRPPKDFVPFSTLMFLEKTPERLTRRSKLERLWLLLLRCAALIVLALLFARPFFSSDEVGAGGDGRRVVLLIDRSASMQREGLWDEAQEAARQVIDDLGSSDELAVAVFDGEFSVLSGFPDPSEAAASASASQRQAKEQLPSLKPGWGSSQLGAALTAAADLVEGAAARDGDDGGRREIVVISDFQEGAERDSLNRYAWPESITVRCLPIEPKAFGNLAVNLVAANRGGEDDADGESDAVTDVDADEAAADRSLRRVRIRNSRGDGEEATFTLRWDGVEGGEASVSGRVPPGGSRVITVPPREDESADGMLVLEGDDHDFDNRAWVARLQPRPVRLLYLTAEPDSEDPASSLFYLMRAMQPTTVLAPEVEVIGFDDLNAGGVEAIDAAEVIVIDSPPDEALAMKLAAAVDRGAAMLWICAPGEDGSALAGVSGLDGWQITEAVVGGGSGSRSDYAMLADLDFDSPVLLPFARAKVRDFSGIHVWKHRAVELPESVAEDGDDAGRVEVLARYDSGSPAWLQIRRGAGRIYLFTSGWQPAESQLALSSKFVPLLYAMLGDAGFSALAPPPLVVGEALPLPDGVERATVVLPGGDVVEAARGEGVFARTEQPGFYTVRHVGGETVYAVNLAAEESRVDGFDPQMLGDFSLPVLLAESGAGAAASRAGEARDQAISDQRRLERSEKEGRQKLWKWLVLLVLAVLLVESWVAARPAGSTVDASVEADGAGGEPASAAT